MLYSKNVEKWNITEGLGTQRERYGFRMEKYIFTDVKANR